MKTDCLRCGEEAAHPSYSGLCIGCHWYVEGSVYGQQQNPVETPQKVADREWNFDAKAFWSKVLTTKTEWDKAVEMYGMGGTHPPAPPDDSPVCLHQTPSDEELVPIVISLKYHESAQEGLASLRRKGYDIVRRTPK